MSIKLTKDANILLAKMYKKYLERIEEGSSKTSSARFNYVKNDYKDFDVDEWHYDDLVTTLKELSNAKLIDLVPYVDNSGRLSISSEGLEFSENKFKNGVKGVLEFFKRKTIH